MAHVHDDLDAWAGQRSSVARMSPCTAVHPERSMLLHANWPKPCMLSAASPDLFRLSPNFTTEVVPVANA